MFPETLLEDNSIVKALNTSHKRQSNGLPPRLFASGPALILASAIQALSLVPLSTKAPICPASDEQISQKAMSLLYPLAPVYGPSRQWSQEGSFQSLQNQAEILRARQAKEQEPGQQILVFPSAPRHVSRPNARSLIPELGSSPLEKEGPQKVHKAR